MLQRTNGQKVFAVFNTIGLVLLSIIFILPRSEERRVGKEC